MPATVSTDGLQRVVTGALERMAFVSAEPSPLTPGELLAQAAAHAVIELRGAESYVLTVSATAGLIQEVVSGMIGCEPDDIDVDDHGRAAVAELANVFGGELVRRLPETDEDGLLIGLPRELLDEEAGDLADRARAAGSTCVVKSALGFLMVTVSTD
mgnify:CR=1 FL=1